MHTTHATFISIAWWVATLLLGLLAAVPAIADDAQVAATSADHATQVAQQTEHHAAVQHPRSTTIVNVTAAQAARAARHEYGGKVLGVQLEQAEDAAPYYRVRLISRGRIHVVSVNAHK